MTMGSRIFKRVTRPYRKLRKYNAFYEDGFGKMRNAMVFECYDREEARERALKFADLIKCKFSHVAEVANEK